MPLNFDGPTMYSDQGDFFDSCFADFQSPNLGTVARQSIWNISRVLKEDENAVQSSETENNTRNNQKYVQLMCEIDLENCPQDFIDAFQNHQDAWKRDDSPEIDRTWDVVTELARRYGVGTIKLK